MRDHRPGQRLALLLIALSVLVGIWFWSARHRDSARRPDSQDSMSVLTQKLAEDLTALEARENAADEGAWAKEKRAQECSQVVNALWNTLNAVTNRLDVLGLISFRELIPCRWGSPRTFPHGLEEWEPLDPVGIWTQENWREFLGNSRRDGWDLAQCEFRHNRFETDPSGQARQSQFYASFHLTNHLRPDRAILEGVLTIDWSPNRAADGLPTAQRIDASRLSLRRRRAEPSFQPILFETIAPLPTSFFIDPLILYDLDGDGYSEIILAAKNLVYRRRSANRYESEPLCRESPGLIFTGLIADFDGDGAADYLCAKFEGLYLFHGSTNGVFDQPGRLVWSITPHLKYAQAMTCGDIDQDGDLDLWLGQYKVPYERGQMPTPYYDANDGNPSYLLLNDGQGGFSDATEASGLGAKRHRRTYSSSFADLDADGDLDLVVVSDFAGIDLHANDGRGHFTDVTDQWVGERRAFGMSHALADFNVDGRLDVLMIGMNSPTADRLGHLGLERSEDPKRRAMRSEMTFGNRLFLAQSGKPFLQQTSLNDAIARSGWSWGSGVADYDNDGFPDVYIANGHTSRQSVEEYEPQFWLHDIYVGDSQTNVVVNAYFGSKFARTRGKELSYGGHERNRLYLNQGGQSFFEAGHLLGVALGQDSRNVVADDLDGDGRMDLLVTTFEVWPEIRQTLRVFRNTLEDRGHWIGFRFREEGHGHSPVGARVTLRYGSVVTTRGIVTGDSFRSQQANTVHFGLGSVTHLDQVEIRWPNGRSLTLQRPEVDQYYSVSSSHSIQERR